MAEGGTAKGGLNTLEDEARTGDGGTSSKTVEVRGFSLDTSHDLLELYFENTRRSGGGDIEELQIKDDVAYITFEEAEVAQRVVSHSPRQVAGQTLTVTLFCPPLQKPCYENRVLVQRLNSAVTEELLTNFLEKETGMKVMEFLYGEEEGNVVVTFSNFIDFSALRKACSKRKIEGTFLQVAKVAISNCIFVKNLQPSTSHDAILFYFENKRRSSGGEVERMEMNTAEKYCLICFVDHDVIETVLCQQHKIDGADIEVHLHHECLGRRSSRSRSDPFLGISKLEMKENLLKTETSSSVSSNLDKGCDFVEIPKWQEDDGKNCALPLWIKYKRSSDRMIMKDIKKVSCSWNFYLFWNFFTKTKQGQQMLDDILKKCGCSVTLSSDDDDLFIFEISDESFQKESEVIDFIKDTLDNVYACAQQSLFSDNFLIDHRMLEDILQRVKQTKELDSAWTGLVGEQDPDAICVVCTEKDKESILQVMTAIKAHVQDCFENHMEIVTMDFMWQRVLKKFGYLQVVKDKYPNLIIKPDETAIMLEGPRDQSKAAADQLVELLGTVLDDIHEDIFSPFCQFEIFTYPEMCEYIDNIIIKLPVLWIPNHLTKKIHLFSKKSEELKGIDKFIKGCIHEKSYPLPKDQPLCTLEIFRSLEEVKKKHSGKIVINSIPTGLRLTSADDVFESVDVTIQNIIIIETDRIQPSASKKSGESDGQSVTKTEQRTSINLKKPQDMKYSEKGVVSEKRTSDPKDFDQLEFQLKPSSDVFEKMKSKKMPASNQTSVPSAVMTFKTYQIREEIIIKVYLGDIVRLPVECIINAANQNLSHGGGVALDIAKAAGREFDQEGEEYVRTHGPVSVTQCCVTSAGRLPYKYVIPVVGPQWHDYKQNEKDRFSDDLKKTIVNCLIEANSLKVTSIAIPSISSGIFGVPKELCAQMYVQGVVEFSKTYGPKSNSVQEIHFVDMIPEMCHLTQLAFDEVFNTRSIAAPFKQAKKQMTNKKPNSEDIVYT